MRQGEVPPSFWGSGFRVEVFFWGGLGFRVQGLGLRFFLGGFTV